MKQQPALTLTPAREEDLPLVLAFIRELADYEKLLHEVVADEATLRRSLFGTRRHAEVVIASLQGEPIGFALYFHNFSTFLGRPGIYLEDLYVRPAARGQGIGRALLAHLAQLALERGCGRLEWNVLDWNEPSIRFYRGLGARSMDAWKLFRLTGPDLERLAGEATNDPEPNSAEPNGAEPNSPEPYNPETTPAGADPRSPRVRLLGVVPRLPAESLERTIAFYRDFLGFEAGAPWPAAGPSFVILGRDGQGLQFYLPDPPGSEPIGHATLNLEVDDALALQRSFAGRLEIEWGPEVYWYGRRELAVRDPNGYLVILTEETDDPPTCLEE